MSTERWQSKARAFSAGWRERFGVDPPRPAVVLGLAVAEHETRCGDAWPGEYNWGAVQDRRLNDDEKAAIASIAPHPSTVAAAREALKAAGQRWNGLHVDSSPGKGYYWIFFRVHADDAAGASDFVKVIAINAGRQACKEALEAGSAFMLADAMYRTRYYEGFYKRGHHYERQANGKWTEVPAKTSSSWSGEELNVSAYSGALQSLSRVIGPALDGNPTRATIRRGSKGPDVAAWQKIVGVTSDGDFGPKTEAATKAWQAARGLTADGIVGPKTWGAACG